MSSSQLPPNIWKPESLGDRKLSEILTFLKTNVARNDISNDMLKELFLSRMPEKVRMSLLAMPNVPLDSLAKAAVKMMETNRLTTFSGYDASEYNQPRENRFLKTKLAALKSKFDRLFALICLNNLKQNQYFRNHSNHHNQATFTFVNRSLSLKTRYTIFKENLAIELLNVHNRAAGELTTLSRKTTGIHVHSGRCG